MVFHICRYVPHDVCINSHRVSRPHCPREGTRRGGGLCGTYTGQIARKPTTDRSEHRAVNSLLFCPWSTFAQPLSCLLRTRPFFVKALYDHPLLLLLSIPLTCDATIPWNVSYFQHGNIFQEKIINVLI